MASIEFEKVTKSFGKNTVIKDLSLKIEDGSFTVLVGPSGCGKTTLLRMIAGIGSQNSGLVLIGGQDVSKTAPGKRGVAMVFQNYAIYPTMTVKENIEFGLKNNRVSKVERKRLVESMANTVSLTEYLGRKPSTLSGGQRQRVALARAMVKQPRVFLMDEPLSNLDAKLRAQMRTELIELHRQLGTTFVYVTHDQVEAMSMADTIVLMDQGVIKQTASPADIYRNPANLFTAQFIGTPPMNIFVIGNEKVQFGFRPEKAVLSEQSTGLLLNLPVEVIIREMLGAETIYKVRTKDTSFMTRLPEPCFNVGQQLYIGVPEQDLYLFGEDGSRIYQSEDLHKHFEELRTYCHAN